MFYKILLCFFIFFVFSSQSFAQEENYILQYARCNELLQSPFIADHIALWESKCIILFQEATEEVILLSQTQSVIQSTLIQEKILQELKTKYYRGEKLTVRYSGELKDISHSHIQIKIGWKYIKKILTPKSSYMLSLKSDMSFLKKPVLSTYCTAESFLLTCETWFYKEIQDRINATFQDILLRGDALFEKDTAFLWNEKVKIEKIRALYAKLWEEYKDSQKILYLLESIDYKLSIYQSIIENTIQEKDFMSEFVFQKQNIKGNYYTRLWSDIFIFTEKLYIYFYIGNTLVNTIQNDLSHFSEIEIQKLGLSLENRSLLAYHLIQKYNIIPEKNLPKNYRLIEKIWFDGPTYIILSDQAHRFTLENIPKNIWFQGEKVFFTIQKKDGKTILAHTVWKNSLNEFYTLDTSMYQEITGYSFVGKNIEILLKRYDQSIEKKYISF